jgi:hypothetical protein
MPTESFVNKQLRLLLEQQTAAAFMGLVRGPLAGVEFTLLGCDYGPEGNVAFKTTLDRNELISVTRQLLDRWARGDTSQQPTTDRTQCVERTLLERVHEQLKRELPAGVGYALIVGSRIPGNYMASIDRPGAIELLGKLATTWEQEAARAEAQHLMRGNFT